MKILILYIYKMNKILTIPISLYCYKYGRYGKLFWCSRCYVPLKRTFTRLLLSLPDSGAKGIISGGINIWDILLIIR